MNIFESIYQAFNSMTMYKLRAALTLLSISIGVFAIMGVGTLTNSMDRAVTDELAKLGDNTFFISKFPSIHTGNSWRKYAKRKPITFSNVKEIKKRMINAEYITAVSKSIGNTAKNGNLSTDPDVTLIGADENYFVVFNDNLSEGRPLLTEDINLNRDVAVIGNDIIVKVFPNGNPIGQKIRIGNHNFTVIGILESKGAVLGQSQDNRIVIPVSQFLTYYANEWEESLTITIRTSRKDNLQEGIDEAIGLMRTIRNVQPWEENSFEVETNNSISDQFEGFMKYMYLFGAICGGISLIAAGVGIMNIMLVSVKERTREIGIRKAIGAKRSWILWQFIIETITLCQLGGLIGIVLGLIGGWGLGAALNLKVMFPTTWVVFSVVVCTIMGLLFGAYPAWKASKLDPIDALRYE